MRLTECQNCGAKLKEESRAQYDRPGPQTFRLWCHECGTIHTVNAAIVNDGEHFVYSDHLQLVEVPQSGKA
jgi:RNase P subunit RPR2